MQILQKLNMQGYLDHMPNGMSEHRNASPNNSSGISTLVSEQIFGDRSPHPSSAPPTQEGAHHLYDTFPPRPDLNRAHTAFSPFSPDPNYHGYAGDINRHESLSHADVGQVHGTYPAFLSVPSLNTKVGGGPSSRASSNSTRPSSASIYATYNDELQSNRAPSGAISRPPSRPQDVERQWDNVHELNGSFANLDLDRSWNIVKDDKEISGGFVPIRRERTPSPTH